MAALVTLVVSMAIAPACSFIQPETGEPLAACVDVDSDLTTPVSFAKDIRPIISGPGPRPCALCHSATSGTHAGLDATGLNLETLDNLRKGGRETSANIVVVGKPCSSAIIQKLRGTFGGARMPKDGPYLTAAQTQLWIDWIAEGAKGAGNE